MSLPLTLPHSFGTGETLGVSTDVPSVFPVGVDGHSYALDTDNENWRHTSIKLLRNQADQSPRPGEESLNPEGLWRRNHESWHHGAGQEWADREGADPFRFHESLHIDIWTPYEFSLLPDVTQSLDSSSTNLKFATTNTKLYVADNQTLKFTTDLENYTSVTGTPSKAITGLASDGDIIYIGYNDSGIYSSDSGGTTASSFVTGNVNGPIGYVKGRLLCADDNDIYHITGSGALPTAHYSHPNSAFQWVGFAPGNGAIYAAGFAGDKSLIYRIGIVEDATALDEPIVAGELPDGEIIASIAGYLGFILLGTSKGARLCVTDDAGNLVIGSLIHTASPVLCFEGQDKYVWFGWSNYDASNTGLGRMNLTVFTEELTTGAIVPAYASDLMFAGQGNVLAVTTFDDMTVFAVSGEGIYTEDTDLCATGTLTSGKFCYNLPDEKTAVSIDVRTKPLDGEFDVYISSDDATAVLVGHQEQSESTGGEFPTAYATAECFDVEIKLTSDGSTGTPRITRYTLKAAAGAIDGPAEYVAVPLLLHRVVVLHGLEHAFDVKAEVNFLKGLRRNHTRITYQEGNSSYDGFIEDYEFIPYHFPYGPYGYTFPDGTMVLLIKRIN